MPHIAAACPAAVLLPQRQRIEDLWLPFFCVTTNLSRGEASVHTEGVLWRLVSERGREGGGRKEKDGAGDRPAGVGVDAGS